MLQLRTSEYERIKYAYDSISTNEKRRKKNKTTWGKDKENILHREERYWSCFGSSIVQ